MTPVVGLDFDNTIVTYDALIHRTARERGLIAPGTDINKRVVRDEIRRLPDGDIEWQKVQGLVYGPLMGAAQLIDGVDAFIRRCRAEDLRVFIVSHKTPYAGYDDTRTNLREAALGWMEAQGFFDPAGLGFRRDHVFFESTREAKVARIRELGCTLFVDDLEEVFAEPSFPSDVTKILLTPEPSGGDADGTVALPDWQAIHDHVFGRPS
ncbi:MAG: hypothetical protein Q8L86_16360 [Vicinamibacterales bacterium]|nr:hypothetical protein [Vicinamibacterales bacterium]